MKKFIAAAVQLNSTENKKENLEKIALLVKEAAKKGAKLVALPENSNYEGLNFKDTAEEIPNGESFKFFSALAQKYNIWLHCGSIYEKCGSEKPFNCTMLISPDGKLAAKYHKIHLFDVDIAKDGVYYKESDNVSFGEKITLCNTKEVGNIGLAICYDIRYGELFRIMALKGADIFMTPADFTLNTGKDHWEVLLRARAIENGCYVIAPNQIGRKSKFTAHGNSMIIDPWGTVIARASDKEGVITAEIDLDYCQNIRRQVLTLENRRTDIYALKEN